MKVAVIFPWFCLIPTIFFSRCGASLYMTERFPTHLKRADYPPKYEDASTQEEYVPVSKDGQYKTTTIRPDKVVGSEQSCSSYQEHTKKVKPMSEISETLLPNLCSVSEYLKYKSPAFILSDNRLRRDKRKIFMNNNLMYQPNEEMLSYLRYSPMKIGELSFCRHQNSQYNLPSTNVESQYKQKLIEGYNDRCQNYFNLNMYDKNREKYFKPKYQQPVSHSDKETNEDEDQSVDMMEIEGAKESRSPPSHWYGIIGGGPAVSSGSIINNRGFI